MKRKYFLFFLIAIINSCGWLQDKNPPINAIETSSLANTCELDLEKIKKYMTLNVTSDLDCMKDNILAFRRNVEHEHIDVISQEELLEFVNNYMYSTAEFDPSVIQTLFSLNSLILGGPTDLAKYENLDDFISVIKIVNIGIQDFREVLRRERDSRTSQKSSFIIKNIAYNMAHNISAQLIKIISRIQEPGEPYKLASIEKLFYEPDEESLRKTIKQIEVFKSFILGGVPELISQGEFNLLLNNFASMAGGIYDFFQKINLSYNKLKNFLAHDISDEIDSLNRNLKMFLYVRSQHMENSGITREELLNLLLHFDTIGLHPSIVETLYEIKSLVIGGTREIIDPNELDDFFDIIKLFNRNIMPITNILEKQDIYPENFFDSRAVIKDASQNISKNMLKFIKEKQKPGEPFYLTSINDLLLSLNYEVLNEKIQKFLKYKSFIVGGTKDILTQKEFEKLMGMEKFPSLVVSIYDLSMVKRKYFPEGIVGFWQYLMFKNRAYSRLLSCIDFGRDLNFLTKEDLAVFLEDMDDLQATPDIIDVLIDFKVALFGGATDSIEIAVVSDYLTIIEIINNEKIYLEPILKSTDYTSDEFFANEKAIRLSAQNIYNQLNTLLNLSQNPDGNLNLNTILNMITELDNPKFEKSINSLLNFLFDGTGRREISQAEVQFVLKNLPEFTSIIFSFSKVKKEFFNWSYISIWHYKFELRQRLKVFKDFFETENRIYKEKN